MQPLVLLVTDLFPGASDSYRRSPAHANALELLRKGLLAHNNGAPPALDNVGGGNAAARGLLHNATMPTLPDEGIRAMLLQDICAAASLVVMCTEETYWCAQCSRGTESGFVSALLRTRAALGLSTASNKPGGVWSWPQSA